jgi:hypothetical protein
LRDEALRLGPLQLDFDSDLRMLSRLAYPDKIGFFCKLLDYHQKLFTTKFRELCFDFIVDLSVLGSKASKNEAKDEFVV